MVHLESKKPNAPYILSKVSANLEYVDKEKNIVGIYQLLVYLYINVKFWTSNNEQKTKIPELLETGIDYIWAMCDGVTREATSEIIEREFHCNHTVWFMVSVLDDFLTFILSKYCKNIIDLNSTLGHVWQHFKRSNFRNHRREFQCKPYLS